MTDKLYMRRGSSVARQLTILGCLLCIAVVGIPQSSYGQAKVGTTGAQFLELEVSARAMGMGGAFTAVADDISAVYYNPAGLTAIFGREVAFTYVSLPAQIGYGFGAIGFPLESIGGYLGISTYALTSGELIERTIERGDIGGTGRIFAYNDFAIGVSYGRYLTDRFSVGFTVKFIRESTHDVSTNGWAADVGTSYDTGYRGFKLGMVITNFGPDLKFIKNAYPLPINFRFGGAINVIEGADHLLTFAAEGSHPSDNLEKFNGGLEYVYLERFALRGGGRVNYDLDGFTAGAGLKLPFGEEREIRFDYAFQEFGILTEIHRFTMILAF